MRFPNWNIFRGIMSLKRISNFGNKLNFAPIMEKRPRETPTTETPDASEKQAPAKVAKKTPSAYEKIVDEISRSRAIIKAFTIVDAVKPLGELGIPTGVTVLTARYASNAAYCTNTVMKWIRKMMNPHKGFPGIHLETNDDQNGSYDNFMEGKWVPSELFISERDCQDSLPKIQKVINNMIRIKDNKGSSMSTNDYAALGFYTRYVKKCGELTDSIILSMEHIHAKYGDLVFCTGIVGKNRLVFKTTGISMFNYILRPTTTAEMTEKLGKYARGRVSSPWYSPKGEKGSKRTARTREPLADTKYTYNYAALPDAEKFMIGEDNDANGQWDHIRKLMPEKFIDIFDQKGYIVINPASMLCSSDILQDLYDKKEVDDDYEIPWDHEEEHYDSWFENVKHVGAELAKLRASVPEAEKNEHQFKMVRSVANAYLTSHPFVVACISSLTGYLPYQLLDRQSTPHYLRLVHNTDLLPTWRYYAV